MGLRGWRWLWVVLVVCIVAGVFVTRWDMQRSILPVPMATVEREDIHSGVVTNGKAEPSEYREVRAEVEGIVSQVAVRDGDRVRQGQKLLEISQRQIASEVERARAELSEAEEALRLLRQGGTTQELSELRTQFGLAKRERDTAAKLVTESERLVAKGAVARVELDQSRDRLAKAEADLAVLEVKLNRRLDPQEVSRAEAALTASQAALNLAESRQRASAVDSPLAGTAYSLSVRAGDFVKPGDLLVRVGDTAKIRVRVYVDEPDLGRVEKGQPVIVGWDGSPGKQWRGEVDRLPSEIKEMGTRKVGEVSCILENPNSELLPNMNLNVEIITAGKQGVLTVPREALFGAENGRYVFLVSEGTLVRRAVQTGLTNLTRTEIREGLAGGDQVALASETPLHAGARVMNSADPAR